VIALPEDWARVGAALNAEGAQFSVVRTPEAVVAYVYLDGQPVATVPGNDVSTLLRNLAAISEQAKGKV
jgi:hypothetical protein